MHRQNWDDLKFVLAVAEGGSVSAAARALGVNHATVLRRIAAFEAQMGAPVFDRSGKGYEVLPDKLRVVDAARAAAAAVEQAGRLLQGEAEARAPRVRITSTDTFCQCVLPRALARLEREEVAVEITCSNDHVDLAHLRADIAVRPTVSLPPDLRGDVAGELGFAVYDRAGARSRRWLGLHGPLARSRPAAWIAENLPAEAVAGGADSFVVLREMVLSGSGRAILPCVLGDAVPGLERVETAMPPMRVPIWVACHEDLEGVARLRRLRRILVREIAAMAPLLAGEVA